MSAYATGKPLTITFSEIIRCALIGFILEAQTGLNKHRGVFSHSCSADDFSVESGIIINCNETSLLTVQ